MCLQRPSRPGVTGGGGGWTRNGRAGLHLHDAAAEKADGQQRAGYRFRAMAWGSQTGETEQEGEQGGGDGGGSARTRTPQTEAAGSAFSIPPGEGREVPGGAGRKKCWTPPLLPTHLLSALGARGPPAWRAAPTGPREGRDRAKLEAEAAFFLSCARPWHSGCGVGGGAREGVLTVLRAGGHTGD